MFLMRILIGLLWSVAILAETDLVESDLELIPETPAVEGLPELPHLVQKYQKRPQIIAAIKVIGSTIVPEQTVLSKIPYQVGELFRPEKSAALIRMLYQLGYFRDIKITAEERQDGALNLFIYLSDKYKIDGFVFEGNKNLSDKEIDKKIKYSDMVALDEEELLTIADQIKKMYREKDCHHAQVAATLEPIDASRARARFKIEEGKKTRVRRIFFKGNEAIGDKKLRSLMVTKEDWLLSFMNKAGSYQQEAIEFDRYTIENYYHNHGYVTARVTEVTTEQIPDSCDIEITFHIDEGDLYCISSVIAHGNDIISTQNLTALIPLRPEQLYSKEKIRQAMETLKTIWGEFGYLYAEVEPTVLPDEKTKTVSVEFQSTLGNKMHVNRVSIVGNKRTRDSVIRRMFRFYEGDLLTSSKLDAAKEAVESLGFFDQRSGVNWKVSKVDKETVDLSLLLEERKTGRLAAQIGFGGQGIDSPSTRFNVNLYANDINALGLGIRYNIAASYSAQDRSITFNLFNPWIFDRPIGVGFDVQHRRLTYDEFRNTENKPEEVISGGSVMTRFTSRKLYFTNFQCDLGGQKIEYNRPKALAMGNFDAQQIFQSVLNQRFRSGTLLWTSVAAVQDFRDHPMTPSRGYQWLLSTKAGIPHSPHGFGFFKLTADGQWLTPLINEYDLIFRIHGFFGFIYTFRNHAVPYRELFHIGGPDTVRGYNFGQIGPSFLGDSLGAQKALVVNAELVFPVTRDQNIRGILFYDGGAGWDTPNRDLFTFGLANNRFNYRHAIGFGVRLMQPTPVKIDVGFKLDRNKRLGESGSEIHFTMVQEF